MAKGWYRYTMLYASEGTSGARYEFQICLQRTDSKGRVEDCSRETAEIVLRQLGKYMAEKADFKTLQEDF